MNIDIYSALGQTTEAIKNYTDTKIDILQNEIDTLEGMDLIPLTEGQYDADGKPTIENPKANAIYLVPSKESEPNLWTEWVYVNSKWEVFGSANVDLSEYLKKTDIYVKTGSVQDTTIINGNSGTTASKQYAFAMGDTNTASGTYSVAMGKQNTASLSGSIALGRQNVASSNYAVAMGVNNNSSGQGSVALGYGVTATKNGQTSVGMYNKPELIQDDEKFIVGTGTGSSDKKTGMSVTQNNHVRMYSPDGTKTHEMYIDNDGTLHGLSEGGSSYKELTKAEYNLLTEEEKLNGTVYYVTDEGSEGGGGSSEIIYSLEEKIIGKWVDGKTLYERTFHTTTPSSIEWQTWDDMTAQLAAAGITPYDLVDMKGIIYGQDGTKKATVIMGKTLDDGYATFKCLFYDNLFRGQVGRYFTNGDAYITIEYIKN